MKTLLRRNALLIASFGFAVVALAQSRTDDFPLASVEVTEIVLTPRPDGGCGARWCGEVESADGGVAVAACTDVVELGGNLGRCTGLVTAGTLRVAKALRFNVSPPAP